MDRKIIVAGSRTFNDYNLLKFTLDMLIRKYPKEDKLAFISGTAKGADFLGEQYAKSIGTEQHQQADETADISIIICCRSIGDTFDKCFKPKRSEIDLVFDSKCFADDSTQDQS